MEQDVLDYPHLYLYDGGKVVDDPVKFDRFYSYYEY